MTKFELEKVKRLSDKDFILYCLKKYKYLDKYYGNDKNIMFQVAPMDFGDGYKYYSKNDLVNKLETETL